MKAREKVGLLVVIGCGFLAAALMVGRTMLDEWRRREGGLVLIWRAEPPVDDAAMEKVAHTLGDRFGRQARVFVRDGNIVAEIAGKNVDAQPFKQLARRRGLVEFREITDGQLLVNELARLQTAGVHAHPDAWTSAQGEAKLSRFLTADDPAQLRAFVAQAHFANDFEPLFEERTIDKPDDSQRVVTMLHLVRRGGVRAGIVAASADHNLQSNSPELRVTLDPQSATAFADLTQSLISQKLAIVLDGEIINAPVVQSAISGGHVVINMGARDSADATKLLAAELTAGALPASLVLVNEKVVATFSP